MVHLSIISYLFICQLIIYICVDSQIFIPKAMFQYMMLIFLLKLFMLWPWGSHSVGSCILLTYPHCFVFWALPYFLELQDALFSSYIFPASVLVPVPFLGKWYKKPRFEQCVVFSILFITSRMPQQIELRNNFITYYYILEIIIHFNPCEHK